jgi:hypothetical protein
MGAKWTTVRFRLHNRGLPGATARAPYAARGVVCRGVNLRQYNL